MNTLLSIRTNILYAKKLKKEKEEPDEYKKYTEIILLCDAADYEMTNDRDIVRKRRVEEMRYIVSESAFDILIKQLLAIKDAKDEDFEQG